MHITSGSDQRELLFICRKLGIDHLFDSIHGSPKAKKDWLKEIINLRGYKKNECVLVGDSTNDLDAALANEINFHGFNSSDVNVMRNQVLKF